MIDPALLEKKIRKIGELLQEIETTPGPSTLEQYSANIIFKRFVERNIELAIEQIIGINKHLISALDLPEPETYAGSLDILAQAEILPREKLDTFKSMIRCRNILIHAYETIDDSIIYAILKKRLPDFRDYIQEIRKYLSR